MESLNRLMKEFISERKRKKKILNKARLRQRYGSSWRVETDSLSQEKFGRTGLLQIGEIAATSRGAKVIGGKKFQLEIFG